MVKTCPLSTGREKSSCLLVATLAVLNSMAANPNSTSTITTGLQLLQEVLLLKKSRMKLSPSAAWLRFGSRM
jgi:hypothetical protein